MTAGKTEYEDYRRQRLEENKRRMEELNLNKLYLAVRQASSPKPSPLKQSKSRAAPKAPADLSFVRRSIRNFDRPQPNYREGLVEPLERIGRRSYKRNLLNRVYASDEARTYAIEKAEEVESGLDSSFPSFVKPMLQSHVTGGFWLGLPVQFCKAHLPHRDEIITLEDEDGDESQTKYLAGKTGLSGGWRGFAIDHGLVDGDALVFQLTKPTRFKVYIIRVNQQDEDDKSEDADNSCKRPKTSSK